MKRKVITAAEAVALIQDGDTVTTSGFVGNGVPDELLVAVEARFKATGHPRDLSLFFAAGQGGGKTRGLNRLGHEGLLKSVVGGHWGLIPKVAKLATEGKITGWNLPQGCISQLYRDAAAGKPGMLIDNLAQAMAVKNAGGVVIVQVEGIAEAGTLPARDVHIPGILVDAVVLAQPENHVQT